MMDFLKALLSLSVSGTILILFLFLMKPVIKNKVSKKWQYYIWLIVIVRLLIPFASEMSLVNQAFQETDSPVPAVIDTKVIHLEEKTYARVNKVMDTSRTEKESIPEEVSTHSTINISSIIQLSLIIIWFVVALILFIYKVNVYHKFCRYIKRESTEVSTIEYLELLGNAVEHMNIKQTVGLYTNYYVSSPLLVGFFKASIVLPTLDLANTDIHYTLLHEFTHYKRRDMFYKWLVQFTICLHWFNPFVHLMGREINHACELSCDEAVIKNLNYEKMRAYGDTLLNAAKTGGNYNNPLSTVAFFENKKSIKERLYCIMNYKKKTKSTIFMMVLMTLILCGGAISLGAYSSGKHSEAMVKDDVLEINRNAVASSEKVVMNSEPVDTNLEKFNMDEKSIDMTINKTDTKEVTTGIQFDDVNIISSQSYYKDSYVFLIGWNKDNEGMDKYSAKADLELSDQSVITVYFDDSCKSESMDGAVLSALEKILKQIKEYPEKPGMSSLNPIVMRTLHVGTNLKQVAENYYSTNDTWVFFAVFPELDSKLQKQYVTKSYNDERIDVFAVASDYLDEEEIKAYAKKAYDDDKINIFAVISDDMNKEEIETYAKKAYDDDKIDFFAVVSDDLNKEEIETYAKKAYDDDKIDFFYMLSSRVKE